jgi:hypothetical protein
MASFKEISQMLGTTIENRGVGDGALVELNRPELPGYQRINPDDWYKYTGFWQEGLCGECKAYRQMMEDHYDGSPIGCSQIARILGTAVVYKGRALRGSGVDVLNAMYDLNRFLPEEIDAYNFAGDSRNLENLGYKRGVVGGRVTYIKGPKLLTPHPTPCAEVCKQWK